MLQNKPNLIAIRDTLYSKEAILADANIPYKLSLNRNNNDLFFCINADEFSDQSFHSAVLDLDTGLTSIIPGIHNGFASAVDQNTGTIYLGGSNGIFKYDYTTGDVERPAVVSGVDIFDLYYKDDLYFIDTASQNLHIHRDTNFQSIISEASNYLIQHFVVDGDDNIYFVNARGLYFLAKGARAAILCDSRDINIRGATTDTTGTPYFIAQDGIYTINEDNKQLIKIFPLENGYGLAFDKDNNIVYSDERSIFKMVSREKLMKN